MHFIFITRSYRPTNLAQVMQSVRDVFKDSVHTYKHILMADLTHGAHKKDFVPFVDEKTELYFVDKKQENDEFLDIAMDLTIRQLPDPDDSWVFLLDDDNILHPAFLGVCPYCVDYDAVVFRSAGREDYGSEAVLNGNAVGHMDWSNFVTKLGIFKSIPIYHGGNTSRCEDPIFFNKVTAAGYKVKVVNQIFSNYNKLPKP